MDGFWVVLGHLVGSGVDAQFLLDCRWVFAFRSLNYLWHFVFVSVVLGLGDATSWIFFFAIVGAQWVVANCKYILQLLHESV